MSSGSSSVPPAPWSASFNGPVQTGSTRTAAMTKLAFKGSDKLPGGLADNKSKKDFDPKSMREGVRVEREHVRSKALAEEITSDHLTEDPQYYRKLKKMESSEKTAIDVTTLGDLVAPHNVAPVVSSIGHGLAQLPIIKGYVHHAQGLGEGAGHLYDAARAALPHLKVPAAAGLTALFTHMGANLAGLGLTKRYGRSAVNTVAHAAQKLRDIMPGFSGKNVDQAVRKELMDLHFPNPSPNRPPPPSARAAEFRDAAPLGMRGNEVGEHGSHHVLAHGAESRLFQRGFEAALEGRQANPVLAAGLNTAVGPEYTAQLTLGDTLGDSYRKAFSKQVGKDADGNPVYGRFNRAKAIQALKKLRSHFGLPEFRRLREHGVIAPMVSGLDDAVSSMQRPLVAAERAPVQLTPGLGEFLPGQGVRFETPEVDTFTADPERYKTTGQRLIERGSALARRVGDVARFVGGAQIEGPKATLNIAGRYLNPAREDFVTTPRGSRLMDNPVAGTALAAPLIMAGSLHAPFEHFGINQIRNLIGNSAYGKKVLLNTFLSGLLPGGFKGKESWLAKHPRLEAALDLAAQLGISPAFTDPKTLGRAVRETVLEDPNAARRFPIARQLVGREVGRRLATTPAAGADLDTLRQRTDAALEKYDPLIGAAVKGVAPGVANSLLSGKENQVSRRLQSRVRDASPRLSALLSDKGFTITPELIHEVAGSAVKSMPGLVRAVAADPVAAVRTLPTQMQTMLARGGPVAIRNFANTVAGSDVVSLNTARQIYGEIADLSRLTEGQIRNREGTRVTANDIYARLANDPETLPRLAKMLSRK